MSIAARLVEQLWLGVNRQGSCGACKRRMLAELTFLPMLILSHTDAFVANLGRNEGFSLECLNNSMCTNDSGIYTLVTGMQVLLDGKPTCDMAVRNNLSLAIQNHWNNVCASAHMTTNYTLNLFNLPYLLNCTGVTPSANLSFQAYYNCTSMKPTTSASGANSLPTTYSPESTSQSGSSLSNQTGGASTNNPSINADQSEAGQDHRMTVILATVIPLLVIFGAVAVTLGVLARKSRIHFRAVLNSFRRRRGSFTCTSEPPLTRRSSELEPASAYASLHEIGVEKEDHIYAGVVQRSYSSGSATGEAVYENGPAYLPS